MAHHRLSRTLIPAALSGAMLITSACGELAQEPQLRSASAPLALALALPTAGTASSAWGADLDAVRVIVSRRNESTALDTTIAWSYNSFTSTMMSGSRSCRAAARATSDEQPTSASSATPEQIFIGISTWWTKPTTPARAPEPSRAPSRRDCRKKIARALARANRE